MAIKQLPGIAALAEDAVTQAELAVGGDDAADQKAVAAIIPRLRAASTVAIVAIGEFEVFLRDDLLERSAGEGRLGAALFAKKLRHTFRSDLTSDAILAQARVEYAAVRGEMIRIAREIWSQWVPGEPLPRSWVKAARRRSIRGRVAVVAHAIGRAHHPAADLVEYCRESYRGIVEFWSETHDVITVPDEPLEIQWTPPFLREFAGAMLDSAGPLDKGQKTSTS